MKRILIGVAAVMLVALMSGPVLANTQIDAVIALHLQSHALKGDPCTVDPVTGGTACADYVVSGDLNVSYDAYLVVAKGVNPPGIAAASCGVEYDAGAASGVDIFSWNFCASGLEFPNDGGNGDFPASLGGTRLTWDASVDCQTTVVGSDGVQAVAGVFYVFAYGTDTLQITKNNNLLSGPELQVGDCNNAITEIPTTAAGFIKFSGGASELGCNPCLTDCGGVPVEAATWGKIKQQYEN